MDQGACASWNGSRDQQVAHGWGARGPGALHHHLWHRLCTSWALTSIVSNTAQYSKALNSRARAGSSEGCICVCVSVCICMHTLKNQGRCLSSHQCNLAPSRIYTRNVDGYLRKLELALFPRVLACPRGSEVHASTETGSLLAHTSRAQTRTSVTWP